MEYTGEEFYGHPRFNHIRDERAFSIFGFWKKFLMNIH